MAHLVELSEGDVLVWRRPSLDPIEDADAEGMIDFAKEVGVHVLVLTGDDTATVLDDDTLTELGLQRIEGD